MARDLQFTTTKQGYSANSCQADRGTRCGGTTGLRKLEEALWLTEMGEDVLTDSRQGRNKQHQLVPLLRQSIYSRLAGYEDVNDAERLCVAPALRHVVGERTTLPEKQAASSSEVGRFETETLSTKRNLTALMNLSGPWIDNFHRRRPLQELILDLDSSVSKTYGRQQGTAYNLGNFLRRLALPRAVEHWSLTTLREKLIKIGVKVTRNLFSAILDRIARLAIPPPVLVSVKPA